MPDVGGVLLHGAVHSGNPLVEALLSLLPITLIAGGGVGAYLLATRSDRRPRQDDRHGDEPV